MSLYVFFAFLIAAMVATPFLDGLVDKRQDADEQADEITRNNRLTLRERLAWASEQRAMRAKRVKGIRVHTPSAGIPVVVAEDPAPRHAAEYVGRHWLRDIEHTMMPGEMAPITDDTPRPAELGPARETVNA